MDRKTKMRLRLARKLAERQNRDPAEAEQQTMVQIAQNLQSQVGNRKLNKKQQKKVAQKMQNMQKKSDNDSQKSIPAADCQTLDQSEEAPPPEEI